MEIIEMEQLAFIIAKELGVDKSDIDLVKSIRKDKERDKYGANDVRPGLTGWAQIHSRVSSKVQKNFFIASALV